jgi:hypothetical protein
VSHCRTVLPTGGLRTTAGPRHVALHRVSQGGKAIILAGYSIGHSKQKIVYVLFRKVSEIRVISLYSSKIVDKKEILHTVSNTGNYFSSDKVGTVYLV